MSVAAAEAAAEKTATDIVAIDVSQPLVITDIFVICSAPNDRAVKAAVDSVEERLAREFGVRPVRREGVSDLRWVLLDYIDIVVHVQHIEEHTYYQLERLWRDCPFVELPAAVSAPRSVHDAARLEGRS